MRMSSETEKLSARSSSVIRTRESEQSLTSNKVEIYMETQSRTRYLNVGPFLTPPTARKAVQSHRCWVVHVERAHVSART